MYDVPTVRNEREKNLEENSLFIGILKATAKRAESGSVIRCTDPGSVPYQNVTDLKTAYQQVVIGYFIIISLFVGSSLGCLYENRSDNSLLANNLFF
jgi:hypothetical protein